MEKQKENAMENAMKNATARYSIHISGIVQGVGFRPFVFKLADKYSINGWINNNSDGVFIDAEGTVFDLNAFINSISTTPPPLCFIEEIRQEMLTPVGYTDFKIIDSEASSSHNVYISPDVSICNDCLAEMNDPNNRRFRYPFTNCTNCGPRFTITKDIPYDRKNTVMDKFTMCPDCLNEYTTPTDRRFHAQPISCYNCGPKLRLYDNSGKQYPEKTTTSNNKTNNISIPIDATISLLKSGKILAIKGLGGYHLACDAKNNEAVLLLRTRKHRDGKPFALMAKDIATIKKYCILSEKETELLTSNKKPIVLLEKSSAKLLPKELSSDNNMLGVMLPYTPLHYLLFDNQLELLVMTSGNIAGEPISFSDSEAKKNLNEIADYFLTNDRDIYIRTDDSVTSAIDEHEYIIRRSRGYVPFPLAIPLPKGFDKDKLPCILATGSELKNTFCITKRNSAFLSHHIGDLENVETLNSFEDGITHFKKILMVTPEILACDLHPEYLSTKYANEITGSTIYRIQHHHAHIASCMAENALTEPVIGVAFDGTGFGEDEKIWGGEFFSGDYLNFTREAHFAYVPMPGGEKAIKEPWRMALSYLKMALGTELSGFLESKSNHSMKFLETINFTKAKVVIEQIQKQINSPQTSSAGRLFDAVSALLGLCNEISYEGQAAILLEKAATCVSNEHYPIIINNNENIKIIDTISLFKSILDDIICGVDTLQISSKFHNSLAQIIHEVCNNIRTQKGLETVVLSGGVFQNRTLLSVTKNKLTKAGFTVFTHKSVPANDGGISYGQAAIARWKTCTKIPK